jgi:hypothetical protein
VAHPQKGVLLQREVHQVRHPEVVREEVLHPEVALAEVRHPEVALAEVHHRHRQAEEEEIKL